MDNPVKVTVRRVTTAVDVITIDVDPASTSAALTAVDQARAAPADAWERVKLKQTLSATDDGNGDEEADEVMVEFDDGEEFEFEDGEDEAYDGEYDDVSVEDGFVYRYTVGEDREPMTTCPSCGNDLTAASGVVIGLVFHGSPVEVHSELSISGELVDTRDNAVLKGYHSHTACGRCRALFIDLEGVYEISES